MHVWIAEQLIISYPFRPRQRASAITAAVISFFVTSAETTTLPLKVYTGLRSGGTPEINALSTLMLGAIFIAVALSQLVRARSDKKLNSAQ